MLKDLIAEQEQDIQVLAENLDYYQERYDMLESILTSEKPKANIKEEVKIARKEVQRSSFAPDESSRNNRLSNNNSFMNTTSPMKSEFEGSTLAQLASIVMEREQRWALKFEETSNSISVKLGFDETPWYILFSICQYTSM